MFSPQTLIVGKPMYSKDHECGYCHGTKKNSYALKSIREAHSSSSSSPQSVTIGMSLENISLKDYEELCNRGFRRSGTYLYKPDLLRNCCRWYTIRTKYEMLKLNKDQRKSMNKFMKTLRLMDMNSTAAVERKKQGAPVELYDEFENFESTIDPHVFRTEIDKPSCTNAKFELYKKYQVQIHKDDPKDLKRDSFQRFLCDNPFNETTQQGHVHELYYIQDQLLAILVLDILPDSISSVYFIWDPDWYKLGLGKISSLREINLTRKLNKSWYLLGYYIADCDKMKYKKNFGGELLDVSDYKYYAIADLESRQILNNNDDDELFVIGNSTTTLQEKWIDFETSMIKSCTLQSDDSNVAESLYGANAESYSRALQIIARGHLISSKTRRDNIPGVVCGLVPLYQMEQQWDQLKTIINSVHIYDLFEHVVTQYRYGQDSDKDRCVYNLVRLLGPRLVSGSVVVWY